eukprot:411050_1
MIHFQTLSKEISYQFYLHNLTQHQAHRKRSGSITKLHDHHHAHRDPLNAEDSTKLQRQEWLKNTKKQFLNYLNCIYKLFALMVNNHIGESNNNKEIKDSPVDINELIKVFKPEIIKTKNDDDDDDGDDEDNENELKSKKAANLNTLWLA